MHYYPKYIIIYYNNHILNLNTYKLSIYHSLKYLFKDLICAFLEVYCVLYQEKIYKEKKIPSLNMG